MSLNHDHLLDAGTIVSLKATFYPICRVLDLSQLLSVQIFGVRAHARNREDLVILLYSLL